MNNEFDNKPQDGEEIEESIAAKRLAHFSPEIKEGDGSELVIAREPGFLGWVKHTWFHHKFAIIVSVFLVVVSIICLRQCATRNSYEELWDVIYYALAIANVYGIDMEEVIRVKAEMAEQKYPSGVKFESGR